FVVDRRRSDVVLDPPRAVVRSVRNAVRRPSVRVFVYAYVDQPELLNERAAGRGHQHEGSSAATVERTSCDGSRTGCSAAEASSTPYEYGARELPSLNVRFRRKPTGATQPRGITWIFVNRE